MAPALDLEIFAENRQTVLARCSPSLYNYRSDERIKVSMSVGRPDLVETISVWGGGDPSHPEGSTRRQMEVGQLRKIKGKRVPSRPSYTTREGSIGLLGTAGRSTSQAPNAFNKLAILEATEASGDIFLDPLGRLLPPRKVPTFDENEVSYIALHPLLWGFLGSISHLSPEEAAVLLQTLEAKSAYLELNVDAETAVFRWSVDGKEHWVRFEHPGGTIAEVLGREPPAYQTITRLHFPLLYGVGRLFAATPKHSSVDPDPSSGEAPASADPEKGNAAPARAASLGDWSRNSRTRGSSSGMVGGGGEILKPLPLSRDRSPVATFAQGLPARWPPPTT